MAVIRDQRTRCVLLDRLGKSIPLELWDVEGVWVGRGVSVKVSFDSRIRGSWMVVQAKERPVCRSGGFSFGRSNTLRSTMTIRGNS